MRKKCTRITSLALVLAMLVSMMLPAFADDPAGAGETLPADGVTETEGADALPDEETFAGLTENKQEDEPGDEQEEEPGEELEKEREEELEEKTPQVNAPEEIPDPAEDEADTPAEPVPEAALEADEAAEEAPAAEEYGIALLADGGGDSFKEIDDNCSWLLDSDGVLYIKGTKMPNWSSEEQAPWNAEGQRAITRLVFVDAITNIGAYAFKDCNKLEALTIPASVTDIGNGAFQGCSGLTGSLTIPAGVKSIGNSAFEGCSGLKGTLTIPASVTSIGAHAFFGCSGLTGSLTIPAGVTEIKAFAFEGCESLNGTLTIPAGVTSIEASAFEGCKGLTGSLMIPAGVTSISPSAFKGCEGLTGTLTIPAGVTGIGASAFEGCKGLTGTLMLPASVTSIDVYAFSGCSGLTGTLTIPAGVKCINNSAFSGCEGLTSVTIPAGVTDIGVSAFSGCKGLTGTLTIPEGVTSIGNSAFEGCSGLTSVTIPAGITSISVSAFKDCKGLTGTLTLPTGVMSIGNSAFSGCSGLTSVTIPLSVALISDGAFSGCTSLQNILFKGNAPDFGYLAFEKVPATAYYPRGNNTWGKENFQTYGGTITWKDYDPANPPDITDDGFTKGTENGSDYSWKLDETGTLTVKGTKMADWDSPKAVPWFKDGNGSVRYVSITGYMKNIGTNAFRDCGSLVSVVIGGSVTSIGASAFSDCKNLKDITIPGSVTQIGAKAFLNCTSLASVTIKDGVQRIDAGAFSGCSKLASVTIPQSVTHLMDNAFSKCTSLHTIWFEGNAPWTTPINTYAVPVFEGVTATAYYPQGNATWTEEVRSGYGGTLTWKAYDPKNPPSTEPEKPEDPKPDTSANWKSTPDGMQYLGKDGKPLTGSNWIDALGHRYVFDDNGILQTGNAAGDLLWEGNQYYLNPDRDPNDPTTYYCVTNYARRRPEVGVTYYDQDGITYRGWVDGGDGKLLYQTVLQDENGKELKDADGFSTYIYVWGAQQIPARDDPRDAKKTIPAGDYLFGEDGVLVTGRKGWYTISGSSAIAGEYYLTGTDGQCALNTTIWDDAKGHRYLFGADGRKVSAGKDGRDVALTINGQYQTFYLAPDTDYVACEYYRPRKDSKGTDRGLTYYNPDGITYRGWVDGGNGKRLYQTVMKIEGKDLYFIVWRAQYLPAGKDPVTKAPIPAGWYLFDDKGVLITKDDTYTYPDTKGVDHRYQVKDGVIVAIDGKAPTIPGGK